MQLLFNSKRCTSSPFSWLWQSLYHQGNFWWPTRTSASLTNPKFYQQLLQHEAVLLGNILSLLQASFPPELPIPRQYWASTAKCGHCMSLFVFCTSAKSKTISLVESCRLIWSNPLTWERMANLFFLLLLLLFLFLTQITDLASKI